MSVINLVLEYIQFFTSHALHFGPGTVKYRTAHSCLALSQDAADIVELPAKDVFASLRLCSQSFQYIYCLYTLDTCHWPVQSDPVSSIFSVDVWHVKWSGRVHKSNKSLRFHFSLVRLYNMCIKTNRISCDANRKKNW